MVQACNPRVGVIADTPLQRHLLSDAVRSQGYDLLVSTDPASVDEKWYKEDKLDVWVVELNEEDRWTNFLDDLLEQAIAPILFVDGDGPSRATQQYPNWERRLTAKLKDLIGKPLIAENLDELDSLADSEKSLALPTPAEFKAMPVGTLAPERVWVLAASLGGPKAVKEFLDCLPPEVPVAFILAQHIDQKVLPSLPMVLTRNNKFKCEIAIERARLAYGKVLIAPSEGEISFSSTGITQETGKPWDGPYDPSIDQVIQNVSDRYADKAGAIVFSGMGNDGSISGPVMASRGGSVWAQTAQSCVVSSQPDSIRETGCVEFSGSPRELALQLVERIKRDIIDETK